MAWPPETKAEAKRLFLDEGLSQGQIAKRLGPSKSTIHDWLKSMNVLDGNTERSKTKNATEAHVNYTRERLIELNNKWMTKAEEFIEGAETADDLKKLVSVYGVGVDKRLLLEPMSISAGKSGLDEIRENIRDALGSSTTDE